MIFTNVAPVRRRRNCSPRNRVASKPVGFDQIFDAFFNNKDLFKGIEQVRNVGHHYQNTNIVETETAFAVEVALPGFDKAEVKVGVEKDLLNITAERQVETSEETDTPTDRKYIRRGFGQTNYKHAFHIPENVEVTGITAKYENGILVVTLPKVEVAPEEEMTHSIEIA